MRDAMPQQDRCLACGGKLFKKKHETYRLICTQQACVFSGMGLDANDYRIMKSLLADRYKAGYQAALDDASSALTQLENDNADRRSHRSDTHANQRVPS